MRATQYVGIAVAKAVVDVAGRPRGETWQVASHDSGMSEAPNTRGAGRRTWTGTDINLRSARHSSSSPHQALRPPSRRTRRR